MKKIGILLCDTKNPFWHEKIAEYHRLASAFNFSITLRSAENPNNPQEQCNELLCMAEESYDALIVNPLTGDNLLPAIGDLPFPVFDVGPKCYPEKTTEISNYFPVPVTDFEEQGFLAGEALVSRLNSTGEGWGLIIGGFRDARHSSLRCRGAFKAFRTAFTQERIITVYADFNGEQAFRVIVGLAPRFDLRAVFCANDLMALGAAKALRTIRVDREVRVGGVDAIPEALEALEDNRLFCTVRLPHEEVVDGIYRIVSDWFKGIPPSKIPLAHSILMRKL